MNYRVAWKRTARDMLAEVWLNAPDRNAVTRAANRIDLLLASDPLGHGESRSGGNRVLIVPPLTVYYRVDEAANKVIVLQVRHPQ
jgi:plasmid stabilization system protein ParE